MSNISTIIFSKDRPAQLDLLLSSLEQNGNHLFDWSFVLYTYSDKEYQAGYDLCKQYHPTVLWWKEKDFRKDLISTLNNLAFEYLIFFVDDNILYRPIQFNITELDNLFNQNVDTLSLRLGQNVVIQDQYTKEYSRLPTQIIKYHDFFIFCRSKIRYYLAIFFKS